MCTAPSGSYIYDGYFYGTRLQAIKEVFEEIERMYRRYELLS
jgi:hypothetical protein